MNNRRNYEIDWVNLTIDEAQNILYRMTAYFNIYENLQDQEAGAVIGLYVKEARISPFEKYPNHQGKIQ